MTSHDATGASKPADNIVLFPGLARDLSAPIFAAFAELAFDPDSSLLTVLVRVMALQAAKPDKSIRAKHVEGDHPTDGLRLRNVQSALSELVGRGYLTQSQNMGYRTVFAPSTYVLRAPQSAAGCGEPATPEADPETQPADPLSVVKAYEAATRTSLRAAKWQETALHGFFFARRDVTRAEIGRAIDWIITNWRTVLKGRDFAALWEDEEDDEGYLVRRRTPPPNAPDPKFLGEHADKFWKAWDAELARAECQRRAVEEAAARAAQYAVELEAAQSLGMTVAEWRRHVADAEAQERQRKLEQQRAQNPTLLSLMAATAKRRERQAEASSAPQSPAPPHVKATETSAAPAWADEVESVTFSTLPTYEDWVKLPVQQVVSPTDQEDGDEA